MIPLDSATLIAFHEHSLTTPEELHEPAENPLWALVEIGHRLNSLMWDEEDLARRRSVPDHEIVKNKRSIDAMNQQRNDTIERVDTWILEQVATSNRKPEARRSSETAGSMIDRLSILSLKCFHMQKQVNREDVGREHIDVCSARCLILRRQRTDLGSCLDRLLIEIATGESFYEIYRQFKMYNDPRLNPQLDAEARIEGGRKPHPSR